MNKIYNVFESGFAEPTTIEADEIAAIIPHEDRNKILIELTGGIMLETDINNEVTNDYKSGLLPWVKECIIDYD